MTYTRYINIFLVLILLTTALALFAGNAYAQALTNQPIVEIKEGQAYIHYSAPSGIYNLSVTGYLNVTNPSTTTAIYGVDIVYNSLPANFTMVQLGAQYFNASGGPFSAPAANMLTPNLIHINVVPASTTYQVIYRINGTDVTNISEYGLPSILTSSERIFYIDPFDPEQKWVLQNVTYNSAIGAYVTQNPVNLGSSIAIIIQINNTGNGLMTNMVFKKQLPNNISSSTGNATFAVFVSAYNTSSGSIPNTTFTPDANNNCYVPITGGNLQAGDILNVAIIGLLANATGVELPPGSGFRYVTINPFYFDFATTMSGYSFLGSRINNSSSNWFVATGDSEYDLEKGYNSYLNKWTYRVIAENIGDVSYTNLTISVYRNSYPSTGDYLAAVSQGAIYSLAISHIIPHANSYDTGYIVDTAYVGNGTQPPVYWVAAQMTLNGTAVGSPGNYYQSIVITSSNPGNLTAAEPYMKLSQWRLLVDKIVIYNKTLGAYTVNIIVQNIGFTPTPSTVRVYDFVPDGFNGTTFLPRIPDYNGATIVNGPKSIGWNLGVLNPRATFTASYVINGNMSAYSTRNLFVTGADPDFIEGAMSGGSGTVASSIDSLSVDAVAAVAIVGLLALGLLARRYSR